MTTTIEVIDLFCHTAITRYSRERREEMFLQYKNLDEYYSCNALGSCEHIDIGTNESSENRHTELVASFLSSRPISNSRRIHTTRMIAN